MSHNLSDSARRTIARIGSLYERAVAMVTGSPHAHPALRNWEWHRASALACMEEAAHLYVAGLESLLRQPLRVGYVAGRGKPEFVCDTPGEGEAHRFRLIGRELQQEEGAADAVLAAFGDVDNEVLRAFAEGLCALRRLGSFRKTRELRLQPDPPSTLELEHLGEIHH